jgi:transcription initiation factor IIE alpha subunit
MEADLMVKVPITVMGFRCDRCGHEWVPRSEAGEEPRACPKCHSPLWNRPRSERLTENEIASIVEEILRERPDRQASVAELIEEIPNRRTLSDDDLAQSPTRLNEPVWHQRVRNIRSHKGSVGNAIYEGRLVAIPGGFKLPD